MTACQGPGLSASVGASESSPLLIPEPEPEHAHRWQPLSRVELEMVAGGPGWRKVRCYLVLLFWLSWLALLATSIAIIMMSPRPVAEPLRWWQKTVFYQTDPLMEAQTEGTGDVSGEEKEISDNMNLQCLVMQHALRFWLEQGVAGFAICDTDAACSEKTLTEWRGVFKEFSSQEEERIVVVKQKQDVLLPLNNVTLVDVVMRSILPSSPHFLSAKEVAVAIETRLQTRKEDIWPSWTVGGKASQNLKKLLLVLMMTLPGSPTVQYDKDIDQTQNVSLDTSSSHRVTNGSDTHTDTEKTKRLAVALFTSLSRSRAREEALLYGSFTFLPFNSTTNSSSNSTLASTFTSADPGLLALLGLCPLPHSA
ncbi:4F2 cell-surface antigen heavy chain [Larimichthys crocea]|uniref:Uncharacterized protein n=1 Tax=Larimichthys crocea TaxID=215358 RepID=A0ACD3QKI5_LARCR|nr:4F2 cell-surface antigen heavy chain [Larimichthys crocea]